MGLLAFVGATACAATPVGVPSLSTPRHEVPVSRSVGSLRVMSYDVNFGLRVGASEQAIIEQINPDIVLIQEATADWQQVRSLLDGFPHFEFTPASDWPAGGMAIFSRYPIARSIKRNSSIGPFFAMEYVIQSPLGEINFLNLHLRPPMSDSGSCLVGYFSTREQRQLELSEHLAAVGPNRATILAGDFNEEHRGAAIQTAIDHGFFDATHRFAPNTPSWHWPLGEVELRFQLDHVLHNNKLIAIAGGIATVGRSDHYPIWVDFVAEPKVPVTLGH